MKILVSPIGHFGRIQSTKSGNTVVNIFDKLTILGKPGAGKTTFLKLITLEALTGKLESKALPIFVSLKEWSDSEDSIIDYIVHQFDICGFPDSKGFLEKLLHEGKCILLLDGYDEIPESRGSAMIELKNFLNKYSRNRFVLSCRIAAIPSYI